MHDATTVWCPRCGQSIVLTGWEIEHALARWKCDACGNANTSRPVDHHGDNGTGWLTS